MSVKPRAPKESAKTNKEAIKYYREMLKIRDFETKASELFSQGLIAGNLHTSIGQEAVPVGACAALKASDFAVSTHRGHGHSVAQGAKLDLMMAELFGKATGYCKGKGGSMHIADVSLGVLGANGIVGAGLSIGTGSALASKIKGTDEVTIVFFGDGASNEGTFHESLNMASAWKLPCVYVCENNQYGISTDIHRVTAVKDIAVRAKAYDMPGVTVDGNDVFAVLQAVSTAVERARRGEGPSLVECKTYRHRGHYEGDPQTYKPKEEVEAWKKLDPIVRLRKEIIESGMASETEIVDLEKEVAAEVEAAATFAKESPWPEADQVTADVYSSDNDRSVAR
ncbi:MAG: pyruvate dehydrogenase (acetyl-transferring) E1 component subunit alpha [Rhodospirillaceae bacterium]|nr:pyruvate dehydrogenase (acetyl-transferring) E1 component subunit alpha [Rhodospirillaceae bacterium]MEA4838831.1 pyruvate dehydrogenase (acetyl-transferring) E1 component subunit alpha [Rhodospirillaceae bacterium]